MGRKIDRIARNALAAAALYLFFASAFHSIWAAVLCTLISMLALRRAIAGLLGKLPKREKLRARARGALESWALLGEAGAREHAKELLEKAYPGQAAGADIAVIARHPDGAPLDVDQLLDCWRGRGGERLIVVSTVAADPRAVSCARGLTGPGVKLIDAPQLIELLIKFPPPRGEEAPPRRRALHLPIRREHAPRRLLFGILLLGMYAALGNALYLGAALISLLFAGLGFRKRPVPKQLFE